MRRNRTKIRGMIGSFVHEACWQSSSSWETVHVSLNMATAGESQDWTHRWHETEMHFFYFSVKTLWVGLDVVESKPPLSLQRKMKNQSNLLCLRAKTEPHLGPRWENWKHPPPLELHVCASCSWHMEEMLSWYNNFSYRTSAFDSVLTGREAFNEVKLKSKTSDVSLRWPTAPRLRRFVGVLGSE